jgi:hypothetical protein
MSGYLDGDLAARSRARDAVQIAASVRVRLDERPAAD